MRIAALIIALPVSMFVLSGCEEALNSSSNPGSGSSDGGDMEVRFERLPLSATGVDFANTITENYAGNYMIFDGFYQGAGLGVGDINNDGLPDIYFAGNQVPDRLYLNKGNFRFEDITQQAGIIHDEGWNTGVAIGDLNGDGWQDIYVCHFLWRTPAERPNKLYINNGDGTFTERAEEFGVRDLGLSIGATIFDYDKDGDNDLYVVNQPPNHREDRKQFRRTRDFSYSGRLYRNDNNRGFTDVTFESGVVNFGYGLSAVASDLDNDGWTDLYLAFDYDEPDLMLMNNGDGTFRNVANETLAHMSNFSMGVDVADINNDGWMDVFVADMVAPGHERIKTQMSGMNPERFYELANYGYHYQYMFNCLQLNNGNGRYSEIGQLAGVGNTDWSWSAFFVDFNLDTYQELFVSNGIKRDVRDNDYNIARTAYIEEAQASGQVAIDPLKVMAMAPSTKLSNFLFENNRNLTFTDRASEWGVGELGWTHGAAFADLDGDGAIDMVLNNMDEPAGIYKNISSGSRNYLIVRTFSSDNHPLYNSKIEIETADGVRQYREITPYRGYMSCSEPLAHFGLGTHERVKTLTIRWPDNTQTVLEDVKANQALTVDRSKSQTEPARPRPTGEPFLRQMPFNQFAHVENAHDDYADEILLPHKMSSLGPCLAVADVDGNGLDDVFLGGAIGQSGVLLIQNSAGQFSKVGANPWSAYADREDTGAIFFDADGDGDQDLYVTSGGNEMSAGSNHYFDRLYINDGAGTFSDASQQIPSIPVSTGSPVAGDYDSDGDQDLFVAGRQVPNKWPFPTSSYILENNGKGTFQKVETELFDNIGMVTGAAWANIDGDNNPELILVGEWMSVRVIDNENGEWVDKSAGRGLEDSEGWWNVVTVSDLDNDGDLDLLAGNLGKNIKYKASAEEPFKVYSADFDENGSNDIYLGYYEHGHVYPVRGRTCSSQQMPFIKEKFPTFKEFALADVEEILGESAEEALVLEARTFETSLFRNNGSGVFTREPLDNWAQFSTVQDILVLDVNGDGNDDLILAGNYWDREVETRRSDASTGLIMLNNGEGGFDVVHPSQSGFNAWLDVRAMGVVRIPTGKAVIVANNNGPAQFFAINQPAEVVGD